MAQRETLDRAGHGRREMRNGTETWTVRPACRAAHFDGAADDICHVGALAVATSSSGFTGSEGSCGMVAGLATSVLVDHGHTDLEMVTCHADQQPLTRCGTSPTRSICYVGAFA